MRLLLSKHVIMAASLYEDVGGLDGLRRLSTAFYQGVLADDLLAPVFAHFTEEHAEHVAVWLAEVFGDIAQDVSQEPAGTDLGVPGPTPRWGYEGLLK